MNRQYSQVIETDCSVGKVLIERTNTLSNRFEKHESDQKEELVRVRDAIDSIRNRPPIWVTFFISTLTLICGYCIKAIQ